MIRTPTPAPMQRQTPVWLNAGMECAGSTVLWIDWTRTAHVARPSRIRFEIGPLARPKVSKAVSSHRTPNATTSGGALRPQPA